MGFNYHYVLIDLVLTGGTAEDEQPETKIKKSGELEKTSHDVESLDNEGIYLCEMPELPDERIGHTMDSNLICGGSHTKDSCLEYADGMWSKLPWLLQHERYFHCSWFRPNGEIILLGKDMRNNNPIFH